MADDCCKTTANGTTYCELHETKPGKLGESVINRDTTASSAWHPVKGGVMFLVGCVLSPCCTPLVVPLALALGAGTLFAAWASLNLGLIYGALTLVSVASFVLAWRWFQAKKTNAQLQSTPAHDAPPSKILQNLNEHRSLKHANK